jgi:tRNA A-37 threonylcarbamoyl transferase component Bud32
METIVTDEWVSAIHNEPLHTSKNSVLVRQGKLVLKFHKPQRFPKDHLRRYFGQSLAAREVRAYQVIGGLGLRTPRIIGTRTLWNPLGRYCSISACEFIENSVTLKTLLECGSEPDRIRVLDQLADGLQRMWNNWILYWDLHLNNMLVNSNLELYLVDPDLRVFGSYRRMRYASDRVIGRHLRLNHKLLGSYGMTRICALTLPKQRHRSDEIR